MGKRRWAVLCVLLAALLTVGTACDSDGKSNAQARSAAQARAKAKRARVRAQQRRRAVQRRRVAQRRAAIRRRQAQTVPPTVPVTVPTTTLPRVAPATPASDLLAIQRTVERLNAAFRADVASGIVASNAVNYWVASGVYTAAQCTKFEAGRGEGVVKEALTLHPQSFAPDPGWVDPVVGKTPAGRIYSIDADNTQTLVPTGEQRRQSVQMRATVSTAGTAYLFFHCA